MDSSEMYCIGNKTKQGIQKSETYIDTENPISDILTTTDNT
jgi:hypothetical protein